MPKQIITPERTAESWGWRALLDSLLLILSIYLAIFLRHLIPLGETLTMPIRVPWAMPLAILAFSLLAVWLARHRGAEAYPTDANLSLLLAAGIVSLFQFGLLWLGNDQSLSRLILAYLFGLNLGPLWLSRRLAPGIFSSESFKRLLAAARQNGKSGFAWTRSLARRYGEHFVALVIGIPWALFILRMGVSYTPDSSHYMRAALILYSEGRLDFSPLWPPLYPILLSLFLRFSPFPGDAAALVSAITLLLFLLVLAALLHSVNDNFWINALILLTFGSLEAFYHMFELAFSDQVFSLFVLLGIYSIWRHLKTRRYASFIWTAVFVALAMTTRYAGVFFGGALLLYAWLQRGSQPAWKTWIGKYLLPAALAFVPLSAWLLNNWLTKGTLTGRTGIQGTFYWTEVVRVFTGNLFSDLKIPLLALAAIVLLVHILRRHAENQGVEWAFSKINIFVFMGYFTFIVTTAIVSIVNPGLRMLAPAYPSFFLFIASSLMHLKAEQKSMRVLRARPHTILTALFALTLIGNLWAQSPQVANIWFVRSNARSELPVAHNREGFDVSPTSRAFRQFFERYLKEHSHLTVTPLLDDDNFYAPELFSKQSILDNPGFTSYRFTTYEIFRYSLSFHTQNGAREITLSPLAYTTTPDILVDQDLDISHNAKTGELLVIINDAWFIEAKLSVEDLTWPQGYTPIETTRIEPYWLFRLEAEE